MSGAMTENAYQLDEEIQRELKGRRTGIGPVANSGPASLPGREQSSLTCPGGCASLHHRLISVAPPGWKITSLSLPAVSGLAALHTLRAKVGSSAVNYVFAAHKFCVKRIFLILFA